MEWSDIIIQVPQNMAETALAVATAISNDGLYIEDYSDLEEQVLAMAHIDLIEQNLVNQPRDIIKIHMYVSPDEPSSRMVERMHHALLEAGVDYSLRIEGVQQEEWETSWKKYFHPLEIGKRLAIVPTWEEYHNAQRVQLRIDPGMAFGTGTHETTFLCLELLDEKIQGGERVLDIGTGSGILAVSALLLGAEEADGVDIDPMCVRTAKENAARNNVQDKFRVDAGDLAQKARGTYRIITANIVADAIIRLAPSVFPLLEADGIFIASGIIEERAKEVELALRESGLVIEEDRRKNGWAAMIFKKRI